MNAHNVAVHPRPVGLNIVNGDCRAARPAPPPNKRMNLTLLCSNWKMHYGKRNLQTFHRSSARPARQVIRRAVRQ